ncbi:MAG: site-2 protease family protein [bacterium]|nr:site-2 protease family protein [bacterium]
MSGCSTMVYFSLFGIPVHVQPWFWLSLALLGLSGVGAGGYWEWLSLALFVLAGFITVLVHELGHALAGRACGARGAITLQAFGGITHFEGRHFGRAQDFLVTFAGPGLQLVLAWLLTFVDPVVYDGRPVLAYFVRMLQVISVFWAALNLLPVLPLDGGQMFRTIVGPRRERIAEWVTIVTAAVTALLAFRFFSSIFLAVMMAAFAFQAWQRLGTSGGSSRRWRR